MSNSRLLTIDDFIAIETSELTKLKRLSSKIFAATINGCVASHIDQYEGPFPMDYTMLAQESIKAAQALMKEWETLDVESDAEMHP